MCYFGVLVNKVKAEFACGLDVLIGLENSGYLSANFQNWAWKIK